MSSVLHTHPNTSILHRFRLDDRVALITGASSGLGVRLATAIAEAGGDVVLMARRRELLERTAAEVEDRGRRAVLVEGDITDEQQCQAAVDAALGEFGRLDVLVNNAGMSKSGNQLKDPIEKLRGVIDVNLLGSFAMTRAAVAVMADGGAVVNISSAFGLRPSGFPSYLYTASKAGLIALTREFAANLASRKIRVNAVAPGFIATEMTADEGGEFLHRMWQESSLMRRGGELDEVAASVVFLASDASSFITGHTVPVDGGWALP